MVLLSLPLAASAQGLHFGTNEVRPGTIVEFRAPLNSQARWEAQRLGQSAAWVTGAFALPPNCTNLGRPCPLLIVSAPSGISSLRTLRGFTNVALSEGWAVLAAEGPAVKAEEDTIQYGWAMLSSGLAQFTRTWPPVKQWPVACGGFSGGAKRSATVAAALMKTNWRVIGMFLGGCNEDRATLGYQLYQPGPLFKQVPIFLSNGDRDPIAGPAPAAAVKAALTRSGFTVIRPETYPADHRLDQEQIRAALRWFRQIAEAQRR